MLVRMPLRLGFSFRASWNVRMPVGWLIFNSRSHLALPAPSARLLAGGPGLRAHARGGGVDLGGGGAPPVGAVGWIPETGGRGNCEAGGGWVCDLPYLAMLVDFLIWISLVMAGCFCCWELWNIVGLFC